MPVYQHLQQAKRMESLPMADHIGTCITCNWWNEAAPRPAEEAQMVGRCVQPTLQGHGLLVSGASGCNKWVDKPEAGEEAHRYMEQGIIAQA